MRSSKLGRRRNTRRREAALVSPAVTATVGWDDLSETEQAALKRMNRGSHPNLPEATGLRLISLGLAVARSNGIGISRSGRELVIGTLLEATRDHADR